MSDEITTVHRNENGRQRTEKRVPHAGEVYAFEAEGGSEYQLQSHDAAPSAVLNELLDHLGEEESVDAEETTAETDTEAPTDREASEDE